MEFFIILFLLAFAGIFIAIIRTAGRGSLPRNGPLLTDDSDTIIQHQQHQAMHALHQQMHQAAHEHHLQIHHQAHQAAMDAAAQTTHTPSGCCDVGGHHHHH